MSIGIRCIDQDYPVRKYYIWNKKKKKIFLHDIVQYLHYLPLSSFEYQNEYNCEQNNKI